LANFVREKTICHEESNKIFAFLSALEQDNKQNTIPLGDIEDKTGKRIILGRKTKKGRIFIMKGEDGSKFGEEKPDGLTISKPEDQIYQKFHLYDYLKELYESVEKESEHSAGNKGETSDAKQVRNRS